MPRLIVPIFAILVAGITLVPGRLGPAAAHQASPAASPADCPATTLEENKALVRRYFEAHNERNPAAVAELLSDDFVRNNVAFPQQDQPSGAAVGGETALPISHAESSITPFARRVGIWPGTARATEQQNPAGTTALSARTRLL